MTDAQRLSSDHDMANQTSMTHSADTDSVLAQRIWRRHAMVPGMISRTFTNRLAERIGRMSANRLSLLAVVQRHWSPSALRYTSGSLAMPYASSSLLQGTVLRSHILAGEGVKRPLRDSGSISEVSLKGNPITLQRIDPTRTVTGAQPKTGSVVGRKLHVPTQMIAPLLPALRNAENRMQRSSPIQHTQPSATRMREIGPAHLARSLSHSHKRMLQPPSVVQPVSRRPGETSPRAVVIQSAPSSTKDTHAIGVAIKHRHLGTAHGRAMRRQDRDPETVRSNVVVGSSPQKTLPQHSSDRPSSRPPSEISQHAVVTHPAPSFTMDTQAMGVAIRQRHLGTSHGRVVRRQDREAETSRNNVVVGSSPQKTLLQPSSDRPSSRPPSEISQHAVVTHPAPSSAVGTNATGVAILQRHLSFSGERSIRRQGHVVVGSSQSDLTQRSLNQSSPNQMSQHSLPHQTVATDAVRTRSLETSIRSRHTGQSERLVNRDYDTDPSTEQSSGSDLLPHFVGRGPDIAGSSKGSSVPSTIQRSDYVADRPLMRVRRMTDHISLASNTGGPSTKTEQGQISQNRMPGTSTKSQKTDAVAEPNAAQLAFPQMVPPARSTKEEVGLGANNVMFSQDMPLLNRAQAGVVSLRSEQTLQAKGSVISNAGAGLPIQHYGASEAGIDPTMAMSNQSSSQPTSEPQPTSAAEIDFEHLDFERIADEVYAIIERRLIQERESRGLSGTYL